MSSDLSRLQSLVLSLALLLSISTLMPMSQLSFAVTEPENSDYEIRVLQDRVSVSLDLRLRQNLSGLAPFQFPVVYATLSGESASEAAQALQRSISQTVPNSKIENLRIQARSTPLDPVSFVQWFNLTADFQLLGVTERKGDIVESNLSWKSFKVPASIIISGTEVNRIGDAYLFAPLESVLVDTSGGSFQPIQLVIDGLPAPRQALTERIRSLVVFDFYKLSELLDKWKSSINWTSAETVWSAPRAVSFSAGVRLTVEPEFPENYVVHWNITAMALAEQISYASGDIIRFTITSGLYEASMLLIIGSVVAAFSVSSLLDRRLSHRRPGSGTPQKHGSKRFSPKR